MIIDSLERLTLLPLFIIIACGVLLLPMMPALLFIEPSIESLFVVLLLLGLWPMCIACTYSAFVIEHFIGRSMPEGARKRYDMFAGHYAMYVRVCLGAGDFLLKALNYYDDGLNEDVVYRGRRIASRFKAIAKFVIPGFAVTALGAIGLVAMQVT